MILGRCTYEIFAAYWPYAGDNPIAKAFTKATKYVVTNSLNKFDWKNTHRISGDAVDEIRRLKASDGPELHIWGSSKLLQTLITAELVDEFRLLGLPGSPRQGQAAVRKWRSTVWPYPGGFEQFAQGRPLQHLPTGGFPRSGSVPTWQPVRRRVGAAEETGSRRLRNLS